MVKELEQGRTCLNIDRNSDNRWNELNIFAKGKNENTFEFEF